jgi:hypothetical protein
VGYNFVVFYKVSKAICIRQHTILWCDGVAHIGSSSKSSSHTVLRRLSESGYLLLIRWVVWKSYKALIAVEMPVGSKVSTSGTSRGGESIDMRQHRGFEGYRQATSTHRSELYLNNP